MSAYSGMVSSDWSQCLSPNGPFDVLTFHYPDLQADLEKIFTRYTGNAIPLGRAMDLVNDVLPAWPTASQMDDYLKARFDIYPGVRKLIDWCGKNHILFMINSTGFTGYFQRAIELGLLPAISALSAHPNLRFNAGPKDPHHILDLFEVEDKARNTGALADKFSIPRNRIVVMGDSGGDGPHFEWGAKAGATLIGSMAKPSLRRYCHDRGIRVHHLFGHIYEDGETITPDSENGYDHLNLSSIIGRAFGVDQ